MLILAKLRLTKLTQVVYERLVKDGSVTDNIRKYYLLSYFEALTWEDIQEGMRIFREGEGEGCEGIVIAGLVKGQRTKIYPELDARTKEERGRRRLWKAAFKVWMEMQEEEKTGKILGVVVEGIRRGSELYAKVNGRGKVERKGKGGKNLENQKEAFKMRIGRIFEEDGKLIDDGILYKIVVVWCNIGCYEEAVEVLKGMGKGREGDEGGEEGGWRKKAEEEVVESAGRVGDWERVEGFLERIGRGSFDRRL